MKTTRTAVALLAACLLAGTAWAQTSSNQAPPPLNLKLPQVNNMPSDLPAASGSSAKPANSSGAASAPGAYYGDTSGRMGNADTHTASASQTCDDSTYNQPQVHGDVGMGVMSGNHTSGSYQSGAVSVTKNLGDCDHPSGGVSFSVGVSQGQFHGRGW
ncbi:MULTISPECIES: hypothetical protein [Rhodanobacter]|uniref:Uncharacterized protein n=1 Tax=Rhodanobacter hydrolyticus TaxID=2250595 RepID=A0ABW8J9S8_9GAMM|nr:hypothetical protein [Rhodanobacter sp. 7MK24]MBD8880483.1 hypothetical protein [Rhodanobacter sp. 7MK24]